MSETVVAIDAWELRLAIGYPQLCSEEVSRAGRSEPCEKVAVAVREDTNNGGYYCVCAKHSRAPMVPLETIIRFMPDRREANSMIASGLVRLASEGQDGE